MFILSKGMNESSKLSGFIPVEILFYPPSMGDISPEVPEFLNAFPPKTGDFSSPSMIVSCLSIALIGEAGSI